jgi:hypothetical protein
MHAAVDELLKEGADDWVPVVGVIWIAKSVGGASSDEEQRVYALRLVAEVLRRGLMEIGDLGGPGGTFRSWGLPSEAAVNQVDRLWQRLGRAPVTGDLFWLRSTPKGKRKGEQLLSGGT